MKKYDIKIGDTLRVEIAGEMRTVTVVSIPKHRRFVVGEYLGGRPLWGAPQIMRECLQTLELSGRLVLRDDAAELVADAEREHALRRLKAGEKMSNAERQILGLALLCECCGKELIGDQKRFCSGKCRRRFQNLTDSKWVRPVRVCELCHKDFIPKMKNQCYCSQDCMDEADRLKWQSKKALGKPVSRQQLAAYKEERDKKIIDMRNNGYDTFLISQKLHVSRATIMSVYAKERDGK